MNEQKHWNCIVVGAGAAGMMAAIHVAQRQHTVLLLDGQSRVGAKILMSGGTRCNVTNRVISEKDYCTESPRIVRNILRYFPSNKSIAFFQSIGVDLIEEKNGQCYPKTQSARTVLDALLKQLKEVGIVLKTNSKVIKMKKNSEGYSVLTEGTAYQSRTVVLATGGLSYPNTGSDGSGYGLAQKNQHAMIATTPALTPLRMSKNIWTSLMGVSVDARLTLYVDNKKYLHKKTSLLFTHFGVSGLGVLDMSRHWIRSKNNGCDVRIDVCFLNNAKQILDEYVCDYPRKNVKTFLNEHFPQRFSQAVCVFLRLNTATKVSQLLKEQRKSLITFLEGYTLPIANVMGYGKAEVTAGGIAFSNVHSKTLESKQSPGLFFCGEILDVDGRIGGFNFQWAWSSAVVAAHGVDRLLIQKHYTHSA